MTHRNFGILPLPAARTTDAANSPDFDQELSIESFELGAWFMVAAVVLLPAVAVGGTVIFYLLLVA